MQVEFKHYSPKGVKYVPSLAAEQRIIHKEIETDKYNNWLNNLTNLSNQNLLQDINGTATNNQSLLLTGRKNWFQKINLKDFSEIYHSTLILLQIEKLYANILSLTETKIEVFF